MHSLVSISPSPLPLLKIYILSKREKKAKSRRLRERKALARVFENKRIRFSLKSINGGVSQQAGCGALQGWWVGENDYGINVYMRMRRFF